MKNLIVEFKDYTTNNKRKEQLKQLKQLSRTMAGGYTCSGPIPGSTVPEQDPWSHRTSHYLPEWKIFVKSSRLGTPIRQHSPKDLPNIWFHYVKYGFKHEP